MSDTQAEAGSVSRDLGVLLETADGADINLVVGGSEIPAHSVILAARSPVFAAMVRNDMKEARSRCIEIKDVGEAVIRQMLSFIYTDTAPELGSVAAELLAVADKYDLPLLKRKCEERLARDLTVKNAAATAALAMLHHCPGLRNAAVEFMARHPEVMCSAGWAQVMRESTGTAVEVCERLAVFSKQLAVVQPSPAGNRQLSAAAEEKGVRLIAAVKQGAMGQLEALLAAGADVATRGGEYGGTALHCAAEKGHLEAARRLLAAGAAVGDGDCGQWTPLHWAAEKGHVAVVRLLLAAGAAHGARSVDGNTPLHRAAASGHREAAVALLVAGADREARNNQGRTTLDIAKNKYKWNLYNLLQHT